MTMTNIEAQTAGLSADDIAPGLSTAKGEKRETLIAFIFAAVLTLVWGASILTFGVPGLFIPAVILVPFILVTLVLLTHGS